MGPIGRAVDGLGMGGPVGLPDVLDLQRREHDALGVAQGDPAACRELAERIRDFNFIAGSTYLQAFAAVQPGEWEDARTYLARGLEVAPRDIRHLSYAALIEFVTGNDASGADYLDRMLALPFLKQLAQATTEISGSTLPRVDHLDELMRACDSGLERKWLKRVHETQLRLPSNAQYLISACSTRPDFFYSDANTAVYIDGPVHDEPDQKAKDEEITNRLIGVGFLVIRFHHAADWNEILDQYGDVFGQRKGV